MNILLFTHKVDIDGMGSIVLSKLAFENVDVVLCDSFESTEKILEKINNKSIYNYDQIFVTDICPNEELVLQILSDEKLKSKVQIFDHHISVLENFKSTYDIVHLVIKNEMGACSGTSLFYEYLIQNNLLKNSPVIDEFVELTRQYDTWEWKNKFNNEAANELNIMFSILKIEGYVNTFCNKLRNNLELFDEFDLAKIDGYKLEQKRICKNFIKAMHIETFEGHTVGVIDAMNDENKNDVAELLKESNTQNLDFVAMVITKRNSISFRSIKDNFDVSTVATMFGGKGHKQASSCPVGIESKHAFNIKI